MEVTMVLKDYTRGIHVVIASHVRRLSWICIRIAVAWVYSKDVAYEYGQEGR